MRELFKNTLVYSVARIIPGITGFILLPIYTDYLEPSEYGKVQSMQILGLFLIIIFSLASERSIFRLFYDYKTTESRKKFIGNVTILIASSVIVVGSLIFLCKDYISLVFDSIEFYPYYFYIILYAMITSFSYIPLNLFQVKGDALRFSIYSICGFLITTFLIIYFLIIKNEGAPAILKGQLVGCCVMFFFYCYEIYKNAIFVIEKKIIFNILYFSLPFIPVLFSNWLVNMSSRVFLDIFIENDYKALSEIGIYSFAFKIASVSGVVIASVFTAYNPIFYKEANSDNQFEAKEKLKKIKYLYASFALFISFLVCFIGKDLIFIFFSEKYHSATYLLPIISLCFLFTQITGLYNLMLYQNKKTKKVMYNLLTSAIITIVFSVLLIPKLYSIGASLAVLIGLICNLILQYNSAKKSYFIRFGIKKITSYILIFYLFIFMDIYIVDFIDLSMSLTYKLPIILVLFIVMYKFTLKKNLKLLKE